MRGHTCRQAPGGRRVRAPVVGRSCAPGGPLRASDSAKASRPPNRALVNVSLGLFGRFLVGVSFAGMAGRGGGLVDHPITKFPQVPPRFARGERTASSGQGSQPLQFMGRSQNEFLIVPLSVTLDVPARRLAPGILPQHSVPPDLIEFPKCALDAFCRYLAQCHWLLLHRLLGPLRTRPAAAVRPRRTAARRFRTSVRPCIAAIVPRRELSGKTVGPKENAALADGDFGPGRTGFAAKRNGSSAAVDRAAPLRESDGLPLDGRRSGVYLPVAF